MNDNGGSMQNMTLRDWFAGQALAAAYNEALEAFLKDPEWAEEDTQFTMAARIAYRQADAMLAERIKE